MVDGQIGCYNASGSEASGKSLNSMKRFFEIFREDHKVTFQF